MMKGVGMQYLSVIKTDCNMAWPVNKISAFMLFTLFDKLMGHLLEKSTLHNAIARYIKTLCLKTKLDQSRTVDAGR